MGHRHNFPPHKPPVLLITPPRISVNIKDYRLKKIWGIFVPLCPVRCDRNSRSSNGRGQYSLLRHQRHGKKVLPGSRNDYANILVDVSENRSQTSATLLRLTRWLDGQLNEHTRKKPFIVIVDAAPCHVSAEYRAEVKQEMFWVLNAFVAAGYTSVAEPLDRAYMRLLKCVLKRVARKSFAEDCLANAGDFSIA
eukprot:74591-Amphidinium_carterae.1